jgi:hypothetical protein
MNAQILCGSPNDGQHLEYRYKTVNNKDFQNDTGYWGAELIHRWIDQMEKKN